MGLNSGFKSSTIIADKILLPLISHLVIITEQIFHTLFFALHLLIHHKVIMLSLSGLKTKLHQIMPDLKKRYPIESIAVFGSYAREEANENSDIDLLVKFNGNIGWEINLLASELESLLGKKVDLVSSDGIRKPYWKEHILKQAIYV